MDPKMDSGMQIYKKKNIGISEAINVHTAKLRIYYITIVINSRKI